jgi:hypothetical protein
MRNMKFTEERKIKASELAKKLGFGKQRKKMFKFIQEELNLVQIIKIIGEVIGITLLYLIYGKL